MKKWVTCCVAVGSVVAVGIAVRQILVDLSDNADLVEDEEEKDD